MRRFSQSSQTNEFYAITPSRREVVASRKVRVVCKVVCNTGWMSDLEVRAKPVLAPLILGQEVALSEDDQALVALWAVKTAMMLEFIHPVNNRAIPAAHYEYLYQRRKVPPGTVIWLLDYDGGLIRTHHRCRGHRVLPEVPGEPPGIYTIVMVIGHLVIHIVGTIVPGNAWNLDPQDRWTPARRRLWPPRPSGWPWPPDIPILTLDDLMQFAAAMMS